MKPTKAKTKTMKLNVVIKYLILAFMLLFSVLLYLSTDWLLSTFGLLSPEELIFHIKVPLQGTNMDLVYSYLQRCLVISILVVVLCFTILWWIKRLKRLPKVSAFIQKHRTFQIFKYYERFLFLVSFICLVLSVTYTYNKLNVSEYISYLTTDSTYIADNYVNPETAALTFPEEKRNLIYIFLESMETTYYSTDLGGVQTENLMPELSELALANINFSNSDKLGGAYQVPGTGWTIGGMVAQTTGLPLKIPIESNSYGEYSSFLPGACTLGDILENEDYNQTLLVGSEVEFGGRKLYFEQHGNYTIKDYYTAIEDCIIAKDYRAWWGFEDEILFRYAKEEILKLADDDKPFNFTMLTADTHFPSGYPCGQCEGLHEYQYANVIACSSKQLSEFIVWIQAQDFYENTTVILAGDHLTMDTEYFDATNLSDSYDRTTLNIFLNSAVTTDSTKNRQFSTLDMFPTTLASMGVMIEGDRLGLGTNLFSNVPTIIETEGFEKVEEEFSNNSAFYDQHIVYP